MHFLKVVERVGGAVELCGFGPIVAAARAASLLAAHQPQQVVLCGIAGSLGESLQVAGAYRFDSVACYGVGVGCGQAFKTAGSVGWRQWPGDGAGQASSAAIGDVIQLTKLRSSTDQRLLLTACAASQDESDVAFETPVVSPCRCGGHGGLCGGCRVPACRSANGYCARHQQSRAG